MSAPNQRAALSALAGARPVIDRLEPARDPEDLAADLIDGWAATETALRSLLGGSSLSGQPLIAGLRQRNIITIDQAHALLEFLAARDRAQRTQYRPTAADLAAARDGFGKLEQGLYAAEMGAPQLADTAMFRAVDPGTIPVAAPDVVGPGAAPARTGRRVAPVLVAAAVVLLLALGALAAWAFGLFGGGTPREVDRGIEAYRAGRLERARAEFETATRKNSDLALPHLWLARVARDQREDATAARELGVAERLEPRNPVVHREIGAFHLARGRYDEARQRYIRALEIDGNDTIAQGWLGCALYRLGIYDQAQRWLSRAGPGDWTQCATPPVPPGQGAPQFQPPPAPR